MADQAKSFKDLLSEAPLAGNEDTVSLVGALARSNQPGKFVLMLSQGGSVTLDASAVKSHQVLGGGVGQTLVQVDVDRTKVPESAIEAGGPQIHQTGIVDIKHPILDKPPWEEPVRTNPEYDLPPFILATAQQAPASALSAMQAVPTGTRTFFTWDINTGYRDVNTGYLDIKHPILDATGRPPYLD